MSSSYEKVTIIPLEGGLPPVTAQYNPKELSFSKNVQWQDEEGSGMDYPTVYFTQGQAISISFELFFDRYEQKNGDVREDASNVLAMCNIVDSSSMPRPPMVKLVWDGNPAFKGSDFIGVMESASVKYTMFDGSKPVRASIAVQIKQASEVQSKITTKGSDGNSSTTTTTTRSTAGLSVQDVSNDSAMSAAIVAAGGDPANKDSWPATVQVGQSTDSSSDGGDWINHIPFTPNILGGFYGWG